MPTTFNVVSLGNLASMDTSEGNTVAENASALVGMTFGGVGDSLVDNFVTFSEGSVSFTGVNNTSAYEQDNPAYETFRINGGADQQFDSTAAFNSTITYIDGTTATVTSVIFQDVAGNTYWAPEFSANADQAAMEAAPIRSISLDSVVGDNFAGMTGTRESWSYVVCFVAGTEIGTPSGPVPIEALRPEDVVVTRDHGPKPLRWVGRSTSCASPKSAPIRLAAGSLGQGLPAKDLLVSPQHRILVRSPVARRVAGADEVLIAAKRLCALPGISVERQMPFISYYHLLFDAHQIIQASGAWAESLLLGPMALQALSPTARREVRGLVPDAETAARAPARLIPHPRLQTRIAARLAKNAKPAYDDFSPRISARAVAL